MKTYPEAFKQAAVKKALLTPERSPRHTAKEIGISSSSIYNWIRVYGDPSSTKQRPLKKPPTNWTKEQRFDILLESDGATLS